MVTVETNCKHFTVSKEVARCRKCNATYLRCPICIDYTFLCNDCEVNT